MDKIIIGSKFRLIISACTRFYVFLTLLFGRAVNRAAGKNQKSVDGLKKIKNVLILRMDRIGDTVLATPFLRELRRNLPQAHISVMVSSLAYNLLEYCPYVDELINTGAIAEKSFRILMPPLQSLMEARRHLWKKEYDLTIVPRWDVDLTEASFLAYFSGASQRIGYATDVIDSKSWSNAGYDRLFTDVSHDASLKHEVERFLAILRFIGGDAKDTKLELWNTEDDDTSVCRLLNSFGIASDNLLVTIMPGATVEKKMWPEERYFELIQWLIKNYKCRVLVLGGEKEAVLGQKFQKKFGTDIINLTEKLTLRQAYVLFKKSRLYVGNDTGLMHIAAAANIPVVEISCHPKSGSPFSGPAPERFGPWCERCAVIQPERSLPPCEAQCGAGISHCISQIATDQVIQSILKLLS